MDALSAYGYFGLFGSGGDGLVRSLKRSCARLLGTRSESGLGTRDFKAKVDAASYSLAKRDAFLSKRAGDVDDLVHEKLRLRGELSPNLEAFLLKPGSVSLSSGDSRVLAQARTEAQALVDKAEGARLLFPQSWFPSSVSGRLDNSCEARQLECRDIHDAVIFASQRVNVNIAGRSFTPSGVTDSDQQVVEVLQASEAGLFLKYLLSADEAYVFGQGIPGTFRKVDAAGCTNVDAPA